MKLKVGDYVEVIRYYRCYTRILIRPQYFPEITNNPYLFSTWQDGKAPEDYECGTIMAITAHPDGEAVDILAYFLSNDGKGYVMGIKDDDRCGLRKTGRN